jgi:hypothetical protein
LVVGEGGAEVDWIHSLSDGEQKTRWLLPAISASPAMAFPIIQRTSFAKITAVFDVRM